MQVWRLPRTGGFPDLWCNFWVVISTRELNLPVATEATSCSLKALHESQRTPACLSNAILVWVAVEELKLSCHSMGM